MQALHDLDQALSGRVILLDAFTSLAILVGLRLVIAHAGTRLIVDVEELI